MQCTLFDTVRIVTYVNCAMRHCVQRRVRYNKLADCVYAMTQVQPQHNVQVCMFVLCRQRRGAAKAGPAVCVVCAAGCAHAKARPANATGKIDHTNFGHTGIDLNSAWHTTQRRHCLRRGITCPRMPFPCCAYSRSVTSKRLATTESRRACGACPQGPTVLTCGLTAPTYDGTRHIIDRYDTHPFLYTLTLEEGAVARILTVLANDDDSIRDMVARWGVRPDWAAVARSYDGVAVLRTGGGGARWLDMDVDVPEWMRTCDMDCCCLWNPTGVLVPPVGVVTRAGAHGWATHVERWSVTEHVVHCRQCHIW